MPIKKSWMEASKNKPTVMGAVPRGNDCQKTSLAIRYPKATIKLRKDMINPMIVASRSGMRE